MKRKARANQRAEPTALAPAEIESHAHNLSLAARLSYDLHIERAPAIALHEWKAVVDSRSDLRLASGDLVLRGPKLEFDVIVPAKEGDVKWRPSPTAEWIRTFSWSEGRASFRTPRDWDSPTCGIRPLVFDLARRLRARVVGDEGEEYQERPTSPPSQPR